MGKNILSVAFILSVLVVTTLLLSLRPSYAHCDTLDGPVIKDARLALDKKDVTPVLKWVAKEHEREVMAAFKTALQERAKGGRDAKEKADMKFFETLVRLHRTGEGESFTGLKPSGAVEPIVGEADKALESGSIDRLTRKISDTVTAGIRERFDLVIEKKKRMNESVEAGREYVEAYVEYVHYLERLHNDLSGGNVPHEK